MALLPCPEPDPNLLWNPITPAQFTAIHSQAEILMFGGSSGPGKTSFLLADAVQEYDNPRLRALIMRESFPQIEQNILPRMRELYSQMGGYYVGGSKRIWTFASGATLRVGFYGDDSDFENYQGGEYSYIGFDESTHHPESHIRKLIPWWRTTDTSLFRRMRLTTNPGGIGAHWHQHVFLRGKCPFHDPWNPKDPHSKETCVEPGGIYKGSTWLSDKKKIPYTTSFIPGLYSDHGLLGDDYVENLQTQEAAVASRLLDGCWCSLEGAYFPWYDQSYLRPYAAAQERHWEAHWISIDYGYGGKEGAGSWAAAGLYVVKETGQKFKVGSMCESQTGAKEFIEKVIAGFVTDRRIDNKRCFFAGALMDPAMDEHKDTGQSIYEMMRDELQKVDIPSYRASKGRVSNAQALLNSLKTRNLVICDTAKMTYDAIRTRMHDPNKPGDVRKVKGDPLDDVFDETAYLNAWIDPSVKPHDIEVAEKIEAMKQSGLDENSLAIHAWRLTYENRPSEEPPILGRRHGGKVMRRN